MEVEPTMQVTRAELDTLAQRLWSLSGEDLQRASLLRGLSQVAHLVGVVLDAAYGPLREEVVSQAELLEAAAMSLRDDVEALVDPPAA